jgi:hypothetical protein
LTFVRIPDSVISVENEAFYGCTSLPIIDNIRYADTYLVEVIAKLQTSYTIQEGTRIIGLHAFEGCTSLTSIEIPNSVINIENEAFDGCTSLTSVKIGNSITYIGTYAFKGCTSLTFIEIPSSVTSIGGGAFNECSNLTKVNIMDITAWCNIDFEPSDHLLSYVKHLYINNVEVTELVIPNNVTTIKRYAFYKCSVLTSVEIPDSVTSVGESAFYGCTGLTSVKIGNSVTSIGENAFRNCSSLTSVEIPDSVTSIGNYAFSDCASLPVIDNIRYADTYLVETVDTT